MYSPIKQAVFAGLLVDEQNQAVETVYVGETPCYVIVDAGFLRHVEAEKIDRQALAWLNGQVMENRELVTESVLKWMGTDDLFTKAMVDASLNKTDENIAMLLETGLPEGVREWLGLLGFRIVVNIHGEIVRLDSPGIIQED